MQEEIVTGANTIRMFGNFRRDTDKPLVAFLHAPNILYRHQSFRLQQSHIQTLFHQF